MRASGLAQGLRDTVVNLNERHLSRSAETVYEALEDAGLTTAAINITTYRGRHRHLSTIPGFPPVYGPKRFFFYSLYESDRTGAPIALLQPRARLDRRATRPRSAAGSSRATASTCSSTTSRTTTTPRTRSGRTRRTRRSPAPTPRSPRCSRRPAGPTSSSSATRVVLCSDHGQTPVEQVGAPRRSRARSSPRRTARRCSTATIRARLAEALDGEPSVDVALFLEDGEVVARRDGDEDLALLDEYPDGRARAEAALRNPNAGEVIVSAAPRAGSSSTSPGAHHVGGGSHGSLAASDSEVPMLTVGLGEPPASITGIKALLLEHFGLAVARAA